MEWKIHMDFCHRNAVPNARLQALKLTLLLNQLLGDGSKASERHLKGLKRG